MAEGFTPEDLLLIGRITMAHGVRGQVKLHAITDRPAHLARVKTIFMGEAFTPYKLQHVNVHKATLLILTLGGVTTREGAEALRGQEVFIHQSDALPLDEDEYYLHDLPGLRVETQAGEVLGTVKEVIETGANEVLVVRQSEGGEVLVPMIKDVIKRLDVAAGVVVIEPLPGLFE